MHKGSRFCKLSPVAEETIPPNGHTPAGSQPAAAPESPPEWFTAWEKSNSAAMDKRFDGLSTKTRERFDSLAAGGNAPSAGEPSSQGSPPPASVSPDALSLIRLGRLQATLPEKARERIDAMMADGGSVQDALAMADFALDLAPASPAGDPPPPTAPQGRAPPSPTRTSPNHPKTTGEYVALAAKARTDPSAAKAWDALKADDTFDPENLT